MARPSPVFFHAIGRDAVGFDVAGVDHQRRKVGAIAGQSLEYPLKNAGFRPAFVAVVERLGRAVFDRNIRPAIAALKAKDDPGQNAPVINPRHATRLLRKQRTDFAELFLCEPEIQ